jgi:ubiquinone/menaquinone biosynthesis C-methylase UbiE
MKFWQLFKKFYEMAAERMVSEIEDFIKEGDKILDLGCGSGILTKKLKEKLNVNILGIDVADKRIEKIPFQKFDGRKIPFEDNFFDTVLISFVLHHTQDPIEMLKEAKRITKQIIIFEDLPENILGKIRCYLHLYSWRFLFKNTNLNFNFFNEKEWEETFKNLNLKLIEKRNFIHPFWFLDPVKKKIFVF